MKTKLFVLMLLTFGLISCNPKAAKQAPKDDLFDQGLTELSRIQQDSLSHDFSPALKLFSQVIDADAKNFAAQYWKMYCEMRMNKLADAKMTFEKAFKNGLKDEDKLAPEFYVSAGVIAKMTDVNSMEYFNKANKIYSLRIKKDKNDADAIANKALIYVYLDKKPDAIAFIDSMIANSDSPAPLVDLKNSLNDLDLGKILDEMTIN